MIIKGAMVVESTGTPAQGPVDITIENGVITQIARGSQPRPGDIDVDARGKYVIVAPRLFGYPVLGRPGTPEAAVNRVKELKSRGADGMKIVGAWRNTFDAAAQAAAVAGHNKVATIEHWYGIPDAAMPAGVQNFPSSYNYLNEADRFRYAGRLWREVLGSFSQPNLNNHGSYVINWSSTGEAFWKENFRLWLAAVRDFEARGGTSTLGEDAGYIYQMYGFGMLRNLELHQEAGFHPLRVLRHATANGNPLEDFKVLYPVSPNSGTKTGIEWTIKAGYPYHVPRLLSEVKSLVEQARKQ